MTQRDINEIRTNKIAVRCDTAEEFKQIIKLIGNTILTVDLWQRYAQDTVIALSYGSIGYGPLLWHNNAGYAIHPASSYLPTETTTPAKYSAEEIKLMDEIMLGYIFKLGEDSSRAYELAETLILNRRKIIAQ